MKPLVLGAVAVFAIAVALVAGGVFETEEPGPAEQAGARIDDAMENAADATKDAADDAGEAVQKLEGAVTD